TGPVDPARPALYVTAVDLSGTEYPDTGWLGPVSAAIGVTPVATAEPVRLEVRVDDAVVYRGDGAQARVVLNDGELADGAHRLTVRARAGALETVRSIPLQTGNLRIAAPTLGTRVRRYMPLRLELGVPPEGVQ